MDLDPDPGGQKTRGSGSGFGSATLPVSVSSPGWVKEKRRRPRGQGSGGLWPRRLRQTCGGCRPRQRTNSPPPRTPSLSARRRNLSGSLSTLELGSVSCTFWASRIRITKYKSVSSSKSVIPITYQYRVVQNSGRQMSALFRDFFMWINWLSANN